MAGTSTAIGIGGLRKRKRKAVEARVAQRSALSRDRSRVKLLQARERYKTKVWKHERAMEERKKERSPSLNPLAISTMPSREAAKTFRRGQARWTALPSRPRYSRVTPRPRLYGLRFEAHEKKLREKKPEEKRG